MINRAVGCVLAAVSFWCGVTASAADAPSASPVGEWKITSTPPNGADRQTSPALTGLGKILLQNLPRGEYSLRIELGDPAEGFPLLLPGGIKVEVAPLADKQATPLLQSESFVVNNAQETILMGGRAAPASWKSVEIEQKDHGFTARFIASDYTKGSLPPPMVVTRERIEEIAALLPESPAAMGPGITDRAAWAAFAERNPENHFVADAEAAMQEPPPHLDDDLFLVFKRKGTRRDYEDPFDQRRRRLGTFVIAECLTDKGRYLDAINRELEAILTEKTWMLPAHDDNLENFHGKIVNIDLGVAVRGLVVATAYSWLGDRLPAPLRTRIVENLQTRVLQPYLRRLRHEDDKLCWWTTVNSNWNAVCHAGVVGTALAILPARSERAEFIAGAEIYLPFYVAGLSPDGYGEEGLGYWNYGFGHYVIIAESVLKATAGRLNWYDRETVRNTTTYAPRIALQPGVYPAFGDCAFDMKPFTWVVNISEFRIHGQPPKETDRVGTANNPIGGTLYETAVAGFPLSQNVAVSEPASSTGRGELRDWFAQPEVLICRNTGTPGKAFAVAMKGGRNSGTHFHLDLGEFLVAVNGQMPLVDPGIETYTARSRYESEMVNSFGHAVPVVAGKGQKVSATAEAKVIGKQFTPEQDTLEFDLTSAYDVASLKKLTRTYVYSRRGSGSLEVTDAVVFDRAEDFGGALLTYGTATLLSKTSASVTQGGKGVRIEVSSAAPLHLDVETVKTINRVGPTRIRVVLEKPVEHEQVIYRITPE